MGGFFCEQLLMDFAKYQGTGNDFVLIDDRSETFPVDNQALVAHLCHRRFGVGADGLILLRNDPDSDFRMVYFNADGAEGSLCGNGGRCIVRFAYDLGLFADQTRFGAVDGEHRAVMRGDEISLKMGDVGRIDAMPDAYFLHTGSPHVVKFTENLNAFDVVGQGRAIRHAEAFGPGGTNVNFTQVLDENTLFVRTYERGVEDETYSCGTGVTAAALAAHRVFGMPGPVGIRTLGGELRVAFDALPDGSFKDVYLIGPAKRVFSGQVAMEQANKMDSIVIHPLK